LCKEVLSLPMHPDMEKEQIDYIALNVLEFFKK
jgi:dTDP-4-amino-4,6-dideoxygalactose transaminase